MVKLALVGTGRMAAIHFRNLLTHKNAHCSHIISSSKIRADEFLAENTENGNEIGIEISDNLDTVLSENADIEGVLICSSANMHYEQIKKSLLWNKAVFVEKPICDNLQQIDELYDLCRVKKLPDIFVGYQRRFDSNVQSIYDEIHNNNYLNTNKEKLQDGYFSYENTAGIEKIVSCSRDPTYPALEYISENMNCFYDSIIHDIDIICFLCKEYPVKVYCAGHAFYRPIADVKEYDRIFITLEFKSGILGMVDWCRHSGYGYDQELSVFGYNGKLQMTNERTNSVVKHDGFMGATQSPPVAYFLERYSRAYQEELNAFVTQIKEYEKNSGFYIEGSQKLGSFSTTYESVRNVNIILQCLQESIFTGSPVPVHIF